MNSFFVSVGDKLLIFEPLLWMVYHSSQELHQQFLTYHLVMRFLAVNGENLTLGSPMGVMA